MTTNTSTLFRIRHGKPVKTNVKTARPCPFCPFKVGNSLFIDTDDIEGDGFSVYCDVCCATGPTRRTVTLAVEAWNDRAED